jgi:Na+/proline symporter
VVSSAFLAVGLLLYVRHAQTGEAPDKPAEVFLEFILHDMPAGVRGLALSGLLAASLATLDSALNAMSSSFVNDLVKPLRASMSDRSATRLARFGVGLAAILIAGFAVVCIPLREFTGESILPYALGVMMYAYTGLLAVYCVALFTRRGSNASCIAAFVVGAMTVAALQFGPPMLDSVRIVEGVEVVETAQRFSAGWRMAIGFACAFVVCMMGKGRRGGG